MWWEFFATYIWTLQIESAKNTEEKNDFLVRNTVVMPAKTPGRENKYPL